jgi:hypothetical protein
VNRSPTRYDCFKSGGVFDVTPAAEEIGEERVKLRAVVFPAVRACRNLSGQKSDLRVVAAVADTVAD